MKRSVSIKVEKKLKSANTLLCRRCSLRLQGEKDQWEKQIKNCFIQGKPKFSGKVGITISSYRKILLDKDNLFLSVKALLDTLKPYRLDIIADDGPAYIVSLKVLQFKSKQERTELEIEDLSCE